MTMAAHSGCLANEVAGLREVFLSAEMLYPAQFPHETRVSILSPQHPVDHGCWLSQYPVNSWPPIQNALIKLPEFSPTDKAAVLHLLYRKGKIKTLFLY